MSCCTRLALRPQSSCYLKATTCACNLTCLVSFTATHLAAPVQALASLDCLPDSPSKQSLVLMVDYVLDRLY